MTRPPRLELTWIGKGNGPKMEPRILLEEKKRPDPFSPHLGLIWPCALAKAREEARSMKRYVASFLP